MAGMPVYPNTAKRTPELTMSIYWTWLVFQSNDLNLRAIIGISAFSSQETVKLSPQTKKGFNSVGVMLNRSCSKTNASPTIKMVMAGVGTPMNESVCLVSILNLASRMAEATVIIKGKCPKTIDMVALGSRENGGLDRQSLQPISPGTNPNDTMSAMESSCLPNSEFAFNLLATNPSKKSNTNELAVQTAAMCILPMKMNMIAMQPQTRFRQVMRLGNRFSMVE